MDTLDRIYSFQEFAEIAGLEPRYVSKILWKSPHLLPPVVREPGRKPYFFESDIKVWLEQRKAYRVVSKVKRGRGRPRKQPALTELINQENGEAA